MRTLYTALLAVTITMSVTRAESQPSSHLDWSSSNAVWVRHARAATSQQHVVWYRHINQGQAADAREGEVRVSEWDGTKWKRTILDQWLKGNALPDIAVRSDGLRAVAYTRGALAQADDPAMEGVVYRFSAPGQPWSGFDRVALPGELALPQADPVAVAFGNDNQPRVAFHNPILGRYFVRKREDVNAWADQADFMGQIGLPCHHRWGDMALDGDGTMHVACSAGDELLLNKPLYYYRDAGAGAAVQEVALPALPGHYWERPAIIRNGARVAVVALARSGPNLPALRDLYFTERVNNVWSAPVLVFPALVGSESIARVSAMSPDQYAVALATNVGIGSLSLRVGVRQGNGSIAFDVPRTIDRDCDVGGVAAYGGLHADRVLADGLDISVDSGDTLQLSDVTHALGDRKAFSTVRMKLPAPRDGEVVTLAKHNMTSMALESGQKPWQCYFDVVNGVTALKVRRWDLATQSWVEDAPPNLGQLSVPGDDFPGCNVEVASTGRVGLTWSDVPGNRLRFAEKTQGGGWVIGSDVSALTPSAMHQLRWSSDGTSAFVAYIRVVNGVGQLRVGERSAGVAPATPWSTAGSVDASPVKYLSMDLNAVGPPVPRVAYSTGNALMYTRRTGPAVFSPPEVVLANAPTRNVSLASRFVGAPSVEHEQVAAYDAHQGGMLRIHGRVNGGAWAVLHVHDPPAPLDEGLTPSLAIDAFGRPLVAFRAVTDGQLKWLRWNRMHGPFPANAQQDPVGAFEVCPVEDGGHGPSLRLDDFDNPRISHRGDLYTPSPTVGIQQRDVLFTTRP